LVVSSHVIMAEFDWVPARMKQSWQRLQRIGQEKKTVLCQFVALRDTLDENLADSYGRKRITSEMVMGTPNLMKHICIRPKPEPKPVPEPIKNFVPAQPVVTDSQKTALRIALRYMANCDTDGAQILNGYGFNKVDSPIGRSLAQQTYHGDLTIKQWLAAKDILKRYSRQIPPDVYRAIYNT
jgi:hypothetical protein